MFETYPQLFEHTGGNYSLVRYSPSLVYIHTTISEIIHMHREVLRVARVYNAL